MKIENILDHWWQFILILFSLGLVTWWTARSTESVLQSLGRFMRVILRELTGKTKSPGGSLVNILMIVFSFLIAGILLTPSTLIQFGLIEQEPDYGLAIIGAIIFLMIPIGSAYFIYHLELDLKVFLDDDNEDLENIGY